jgi:demethylmenaquinone methyltransferase/2-methoxy-6-polyprenyl-1,4-benzoquinol methylase
VIGAAAPTTAERDPYVGYTRRFFRKWLPVYDLFALCIAPVYRAAAREVPCAPGRTGLDVCAGTGEMAIRCARAGSPVTAVDITPEMLGQARRKAGDLPICFAIMDARRLSHADGTFDCAVISLALHDMPRKVGVQVLREAARVTRERLIVTDYDFPRSLPLRRLWIALVDLFESAYFRRCAEEGIEPLFADAGLAARARRRRGRLPLFAIWSIDLRGAA